MEYIVQITAKHKPQPVPCEKKDLTLKFLQELVDGDIEAVKVIDKEIAHALPDILMLVNEEGLLKDYRFNAFASKIVTPFIFGDAVLVMVDDEDFRPLTQKELEKLTSVWSAMKEGD